MNITIAIQFQCLIVPFHSLSSAQHELSTQTFNYSAQDTSEPKEKKIAETILEIIFEYNDASGVICYDPGRRRKKKNNYETFPQDDNRGHKIHGKATNDVHFLKRKLK